MVEEPDTEQADEERTFTQDEVNRIVGKAKAKFKDYDELKAKAQAYDELQESSKTELERATERAERAEAEASALRAQVERREWAASVAASSGVSERLLSHVSASSEEELRAIADEIKADMPRQAVVVESDGRAADKQPEGTAGDWLRSTLPRRYAQH